MLLILEFIFGFNCVRVLLLLRVVVVVLFGGILILLDEFGFVLFVDVVLFLFCIFLFVWIDLYDLNILMIRD